MLVLSREIGESFILANRTIVTVAVAGEDFVDLGLSEKGGRRLGVVTLVKGIPTSVAHGVSGVLIYSKGTRIRLGFEVPPHVSCERMVLPADNMWVDS